MQRNIDPFIIFSQKRQEVSVENLEWHIIPYFNEQCTTIKKYECKSEKSWFLFFKWIVCLKYLIHNFV